MIRSYKAISVLCAFLLAAALFAGCSPSSGKITPSKPKSLVAQVKPINVRVLNPPLSAGRGAAPYVSLGTVGQVMTDRINNIQTKYNCTIEYVGNGDWSTRDDFNQSILTGEPMADIANVGYEPIIQGVGRGGIYAVLNDYTDELDMTDPDLWDQDIIQRMCTVKGLTFAVSPELRGYERVNAGMVMYFKRSMLQREGLWDQNNLYDLQKNKEWTWDKFASIAEKVLKDTNGDGKDDQFGFMRTRYTDVAFNASNTDDPVKAGFYGVVDNNAVFLGREKAKMDLFDFYRQNGVKGKSWLRSKDYGQDFYTGPRNDFAAGDFCFMVDNGEVIRTLSEMKMKDTVGVIAVPIGPDKPTKEYTVGREGCVAWAMPKNVKEPKSVAIIMKELCKPLYTKEEADAGIEAFLGDYIGNEQDIVDTYKMLGEQPLVCSTDSVFIATWQPAFAQYMGNIAQIVENNMTGSDLNKRFGDAVQSSMNVYWKEVMTGWDQANQDYQDGK